MTTLIDYSNIQSLPEVWSIVAQRFPNIIALHDPHSKPEVILTYRELYQQIQQFAAALQAAHSGDAPVLIRIETKAGHGAGKPTTKIIEEAADKWGFLVRVLGISNSIPSK